MSEIINNEASGVKAVPASSDDIAAWFKTAQAVIGLAGMVVPPRPGVHLFMVALEYKHFDPFNEPLNEKFRLAMVDWNGSQWMLACVPEEYLAPAQEIAEAIGMRLRNGFPVMSGSGGMVPFPFAYPCVWTLEGVLGGYHNRAGAHRLTDERLMRTEQQMVDQILSTYVVDLRTFPGAIGHASHTTVKSDDRTTD